MTRQQRRRHKARHHKRRVDKFWNESVWWILGLANASNANIRGNNYLVIAQALLDGAYL